MGKEVAFVIVVSQDDEENTFIVEDTWTTYYGLANTAIAALQEYLSRLSSAYLMAAENETEAELKRYVDYLGNWPPPWCSAQDPIARDWDTPKEDAAWEADDAQ